MASDAEIHSAAQAYALRHGVSYFEAAKQVVASAPAPTYVENLAPVGGYDDAQIHARAMSYAASNKVSYTDAISAVRDMVAYAAQASAESRAPTDGTGDDALDRVAKVYALSKKVPYADALSAVRSMAMDRGVSYSELISSTDGLVCFRESAQGVISFASAADLENQWIDIFRTGEHIDDAGTARVFTEGDINDIAQGYRPAIREAPLVIGHPATDGPAFGWVAELRRGTGGVLQMRAKQVNERFAEMVRKGLFKKRSAALYPPSHPSNPNPGKWYLQHVGFLGAAQPAIAGLADPVL